MLNHPELRSEIVSLLPTPDLTDMEEKLNFLKKNIYKVTYRTAVLRLQIPPDPDQHVERRDPTPNPHIKRSGSKTMMARMNYCSPSYRGLHFTSPPPPGGKKWPSRLGGKNVKCFMSSFWTQPYKWLGRYKRKSVSAGIRLHTIQSLFIGPVQTVKIKLSHIL